MDIVYLYRRSINEDFEIRYSLRSVERYMPYVRKIWIFGDRPAFLVDDTSLIEHVPHDYIAAPMGFDVPVRNFFLLLFLSSLIPGLSEEYLRFSDDFVLLGDLSEEDARKNRYLQEMDAIPPSRRKGGSWGDALWYTYDKLKELGYPALNFETHAPCYLTRKRVWDAYAAFRPYVSQERFGGMLGNTAIMNHAYRHEAFVPVNIQTENSLCGFHKQQVGYEALVNACRRKLFMNYDEWVVGPGLLQFLVEKFPDRSRYENDHGYYATGEVTPEKQSLLIS